MNQPDPEPMMSLDKFTEQTGLSTATMWRWRKMGMLSTINICGRVYILRSEIARFNARAVAGEFAKTPITPKRVNSP
jgi:predicted site-specific integrase-resolvase